MRKTFTFLFVVNQTIDQPKVLISDDRHNNIHTNPSSNEITISNNQRLPGACNRSPGSKLLSITTQLHCGGHLGRRAQLPDTILEEDHPMTIPSKFGFN
jgi:hypothetical protein